MPNYKAIIAEMVSLQMELQDHEDLKKRTRCEELWRELIDFKPAGILK